MKTYGGTWGGIHIVTDPALPPDMVLVTPSLGWLHNITLAELNWWYRWCYSGQS